MTSKLSPIERALIAASTMPAPDARRVLMLICESGMTMNVPRAAEEPTEGQKHYAKREKFIKQYHSACNRVLKYAKHETLRNIEKHFREVPGIESAEGSELPSSLAARLTFKSPRFKEELLAALREEALSALTIAGQQLFDEVGRDDPWKMPGDYSTGFLNYRANLLADVPDEVHKTIMTEIQQGLDAGDSRRELMKRISTKFDETYKGRMETVANTETAAAFNFARDKAMKEAGVTHKKWLLSHSPLIKEHRATHAENDGQTQPIDEPFDIGGVQFMYPGDDTLGAGPEDIINCHCVAIPVEAPVKSGEGEGHPFRGNQYTGGKAGQTEVDVTDPEGSWIAPTGEVHPVNFGETHGEAAARLLKLNPDKMQEARQAALKQGWARLRRVDKTLYLQAPNPTRHQIAAAKDVAILNQLELVFDHYSG